ncbi:MAG: serine protease [Chloroflexota bacterium]
MPTWGEILKELNTTRAPEGSGWDFDGVRRKYLKELHDYTKRAVIIYCTAFLEPRPMSGADLQIGLQDIAGFMEAASNVDEKQLDLIVHSPGGSAEAAESIVTYLRKRFDNIRVFVPVAAMSAATMITLSADEVVMGQHSQLGPIDPQFTIQTPEGPRSAPAKAILNQFELAKRECREASNLAAWMPILRGYMPGLLTQCEDSRMLAVRMVSTWLQQYMFANDNDAVTKATAVADWFADYESFQTHGRRVSPDEAIAKGLKVVWLESDPKLQDAVLSVYHAVSHTFTRTAATKIIENHHGRAWIRTIGPVLVPGPGQPPVPPHGTVPSNRAERRRLVQGRG